MSYSAGVIAWNRGWYFYQKDGHCSTRGKKKKEKKKDDLAILLSISLVFL